MAKVNATEFSGARASLMHCRGVSNESITRGQLVLKYSLSPLTTMDGLLVIQTFIELSISFNVLGVENSLARNFTTSLSSLAHSMAWFVITNAHPLQFS